MRQLAGVVGISVLAAALAACGGGEAPESASIYTTQSPSMSEQERDFLHAMNGVGWPVEANDEAVGLAGSVCDAFEQGTPPQDLAVLMSGLADRADSYTIMAIMAEHYCPDVPQVADLPTASPTAAAETTS